MEKIGEIKQKLNEDTASGSRKIKELYLRVKDKTDLALALEFSEITQIKAENKEAVYQAFLKIIENHVLSEADIQFKNELVIKAISFLSNEMPTATTSFSKVYAQQSTEQLKAKKEISEIQSALLNGKYMEAFPRLKKIQFSSEINPGMKLYLIWIKVGLSLVSSKKSEVGNIEGDLNALHPIERESAEYWYVRALLAKLKKEIMQSKRYFELAVQKNKSFASYSPIKPSFFQRLLSRFKSKSV